MHPPCSELEGPVAFSSLDDFLPSRSQLSVGVFYLWGRMDLYPGGVKFLLRTVLKNPGVICASPAFLSMSVVPSRWSNAIEHCDGLDLLRDALELVGES